LRAAVRGVGVVRNGEVQSFQGLQDETLVLFKALRVSLHFVNVPAQLGCFALQLGCFLAQLAHFSRYGRRFQVKMDSPRAPPMRMAMLATVAAMVAIILLIRSSRAQTRAMRRFQGAMP
jgi:hypothetical protein